jgi:DNA-binding HxlR family transcriptional regulator
LYTRITFVSNRGSLAALIELVHNRWSVPVLAELHRTGGTRVVTLCRRTGAGGESVRRALTGLVARGLVTRNPGYGHPLRPEYVLTPAGARIAPACALVLDELAALEIGDIGLNKWSMPVLAALAADRRFSELRGELPGVSPRALTLARKALAEAGMVERTVLASYPPQTVYRLADRASGLGPALEQIAAAAA